MHLIRAIYLIGVLMTFIPKVVQADVKRISSISKDLGRVEKIYLSEGLISIIEFPEAVSEVKVGNTKDFNVLLSEKHTTELTIFLSRGAVGTFTNLIVRTGRGVYVFDLVASKHSHQDYMKVTGAYGRPLVANGKMKLIESVVIEPKGRSK